MKSRNVALGMMVLMFVAGQRALVAFSADPPESKSTAASRTAASAVDRELARLEQALRANTARRKAHNMNPPDPTDGAAVARFNARASAGRQEFQRLKALYLALRNSPGKPGGGGLPATAARSAEVDRKVADLKRKRDLAERELKRILKRSAGYERALRTWAELPESARAQARAQACQMLVDLLLLDRKINLRDEAALTRQRLNELERKILKPQATAASREQYARVLAELRSVRGREGLIEFFDKSKSFTSLTSNLAADQKAEAMAGILTMFVAHPSAQLLLADIEIATAVGYAHLARHVAYEQVEILHQLTEDDLTQVREYGAAMVKFTDELQTLQGLKNHSKE